MRTFVKIEGKDVDPIVRELAKIVLNFPEICVWDHNLLSYGWNYQFSNDALGLGRVQDYFNMDASDFQKNCDRIISKTGADLGDSNIYFEWHEPPTKDQLDELSMLIEKVVKPYGNKYHITNK